jgi:metal-responsive CopG/Arc/MetJ family transcriptional regulator
MTAPKARQAKAKAGTSTLTRASIHMDAALLKKLDGVADFEGLSRSAIITRFVKAGLQASGKAK